MPTLTQTLPANDLGFLRIIATLWGIELAATEAAEAAVELADSLADVELLDEIIATLPKDGRAALLALASENGRMPWVAFVRRFGEVREMGPGKRDREQPHLHPNSAAEVLWYRALIGKAFFEGEKGLQEFAFIPDDLLMVLDFPENAAAPEPEYEDPSEMMAEEEPEEEAEEEKPAVKTVSQTPAPVPAKVPPPLPKVIPETIQLEKSLGRPASPAEKAFPTPASDRILDETCTLLAALRAGKTPPETKIPARVMEELLAAAKIIRSAPDGRGAEVLPEPVKNFLEAPRPRALEILVSAWQESETFNELRQIPGLICEGAWKNEPFVTREFLLNLLEPVPDGQWWSLAAFVRDLKTKYPDFQRPAGDYDSWFIKRAADGAYLRGFAHWDEVDGALIRYLITGPLSWLGLVELASPEAGAAPTAFRSTSRTGDSPEEAKLNVSSQGKISVPRLTPRVARYQIARFCEWDEEKDDEYRYRVTPGSLKRAKEQGLKPEHLLTVLRKHASAPLPPPFVRSLQRWESSGTEARIETLTVLKVSRPEILEELRNSKAARFLGEILGPTTITVQSGAAPKVLAALAELGLLAEGGIDPLKNSAV
jgi:hypothetical protein